LNTGDRKLKNPSGRVLEFEGYGTVICRMIGDMVLSALKFAPSDVNLPVEEEDVMWIIVLAVALAICP
jgi:hypothetical protein